MKRLVLIALLGAAACGEDANVAGSYTAALTDRSDGCTVGLTPGQQSTTRVTVVQSGSDVTLMVLDLAGGLLALQTGTNAFTGDVDGNSLDLKITGTSPKTAGNCMYTYNATIDATQDGDTMTGRVQYRAATNGDDSCGARTGCVSTQDFNATRPPPASGG